MPVGIAVTIFDMLDQLVPVVLFPIFVFVLIPRLVIQVVNRGRIFLCLEHNLWQIFELGPRFDFREDVPWKVRHRPGNMWASPCWCGCGKEGGEKEEKAKKLHSSESCCPRQGRVGLRLGWEEGIYKGNSSPDQRGFAKLIVTNVVQDLCVRKWLLAKEWQKKLRFRRVSFQISDNLRIEHQD